MSGSIAEYLLVVSAFLLITSGIGLSISGLIQCILNGSVLIKLVLKQIHKAVWCIILH